MGAATSGPAPSGPGETGAGGVRRLLVSILLLGGFGYEDLRFHPPAAIRSNSSVCRRRIVEISRRNPQISDPPPEEELAHAKRWREHWDRDAAFQLVTSHLRLVAKIAMRYRGYGLPIADLVSEGNIGLMQAVKRFDPDRGVRLATYAMWWIRATIQEYILRSWSHVKVAASAGQKKLFFKLRQAKSAISAFQDGDLRPDQAGLIAERLKVAERDVVDMNQRLQGDVSLNAPVSHDEDKAGDALDWLVDPAPTQEMTFAEQQETAYRHQALKTPSRRLTPANVVSSSRAA